MEKVPLLQSFINGDDAYRNSRFKLIPYISKVRLYLNELPNLRCLYLSLDCMRIELCLWNISRDLGL